MKETAGDKVRRLIKWYEDNKPEAGLRIEVAMTPKKLAKEFGFQRAEKQREFEYRGRRLIATGQDE